MARHPFTDHIPNLRRYAIALLRDRALADDLVQDTLERGLKKFSLYQRDTDLRAWLFTIMHNVFVNQLPRNRAWLQAALLATEPVTSHDDAETMLAVRDLSSALQQLTSEQRAVILLVGLEQLSYEQAATVMNLPVGTIMSRLSRARERLHVLMNGEPGSPLRSVK